MNVCSNPIRVLALLVTIVSASLGSAVPGLAAGMRAVEGNVTYRERMVFPSGARLTVKLVDVSLQDVSSVTIAQTTKPASASPIAYRLRYAPQRIAKERSYALQAQIHVGGKLWFTSTTHVPFTGQARVDIPVERAGSAEAPPVNTSPVGRWLAEDIRGGGVLDRL